MTPKLCGRLDDHDRHHWTLSAHGCGVTGRYEAANYDCKGFVLIEGGAR